MSKVLLLDTNFSSIPIYNYLEQRGYETYVVGNNPEDALAKCARNYIQQDYSDIDRTRRLIRDVGIDYLIPGCNDTSYRACSTLNETGDFPGIDHRAITDTLNNKKLFREFSRTNDLPSPRALRSSEYGARWPVIIKPVDAYSGRGISILHRGTEKEFEKAIHLAESFSLSREHIVEDYLEGSLYSHSAFLYGQEIAHDVLVEEHGSANPFVVDTSRISNGFPSTALDRIRESVVTIAKKLRLNNGLIHTQFLLSGDQIWLIEVTRRCPGDLYSTLIELATGFNYVENYIRPFLSLPYHLGPTFDEAQNIMRHTISSPHSFIFTGLQFRERFLTELFVPLAQPGDKIEPSPHGRVAILFAKITTHSELNGLITKTLDRKLYRFNS